MINLYIMNYYVVFKNRKIEYNLIRKNVKNINLRIKQDGKVYISANNRISIASIENFILQNGDKILSYLDKPRRAAEFKEGAKVFLLGGEKTIKVVSSNAEYIRLDGEHLIFYVNKSSDLGELFDKWLKEQGKVIFEELLHKNYNKVGAKKCPTLKVRKMTSRWGSCNGRKDIITINSILLCAPMACVEAVIMHELCHLKVPNHSKRFYDLLLSIMPDYKERKKLLKKQNYFI